MAITITEFIEALQNNVDEIKRLEGVVTKLEDEATVVRTQLWELAQAQGIKEGTPYLHRDIINRAITDAKAQTNSG